MIVFVTEEAAWRLPELAEQLMSYPGVVSVYHNINSNLKIMLGRRFRLLAGVETIEDTIGNIHFQISPQSFFQINNEQAQVLYEKALEYAGLSGKEQVADIYCGIGTISMYLAQQAKEVIGIESVGQAVLDAKENARNNQVENCTFVAAKAEDWLPKWAKQGNQLDVAVIDPPRKGCETPVLDALITSGAKRIVYVSCNPSTLARDAKYLCQYGYEVKAIQPVDLFCQSWHVETVVLLSQQKPDSYININVDFGDGEGPIPTDKIMERAEKFRPKDKVTYKVIKEYIFEKFGFKVHTAYIAEVKRSLGLPMYDAPNTVEKLKNPRKQPTPIQMEAIKDALKHFEVI